LSIRSAHAQKLGIDQVGDALRATNQVTSVGRLAKDYRQYLVLTTSELTSLHDVRKVVVAFRQQTPVYLGDLAEVRERRPIARRSSRATAGPRHRSWRSDPGGILQVVDEC
jgi:multidrug efflux pump subunit AcrB